MTPDLSAEDRAAILAPVERVAADLPPETATIRSCRLCDGTGHRNGDRCDTCDSQGRYLWVETPVPCETCQQTGMVPILLGLDAVSCLACRGWGYALDSRIERLS